jgi:putative acetyltransferase
LFIAILKNSKNCVMITGEITISNLNPKELSKTKAFSLLLDIYSSGLMSETFNEKFASPVVAFEYLAGIVAMPGGIVLLAEAGGEYIGYISVKPRKQSRLKHTADLTMGVSSGYQGKGIGRELLNRALHIIACEKIIEIVYLMVRTDNLPALRLYENSGFRQLAILERDTKIDGKYYDGILMRRFV